MAAGRYDSGFDVPAGITQNTKQHVTMHQLLTACSKLGCKRIVEELNVRLLTAVIRLSVSSVLTISNLQQQACQSYLMLFHNN